MQTPHLTQPDNVRLLRGTRALWADACAGSSLCRLSSHGVLAHLRLNPKAPRSRMRDLIRASLW